jgi:hypothetical protein
MLPLSVPFAPGIYKVVAGIPLVIFAVLALCWGWNNLCLTVRMLQGRSPLPRRSSTPFVVVGVTFYLVVLAGDSRAEFGDAGGALESVLATVSARAPSGTVRPCEHGSLDHSWSY